MFKDSPEGQTDYVRCGNCKFMYKNPNSNIKNDNMCLCENSYKSKCWVDNYQEGCDYHQFKDLVN